MSSPNKPFLTIDQQISLLKSKNLLIPNEQGASKNLLSYGYYEIINGYKDCFLDSSSTGKEKFKDGITFEHIFALFTLDRNIRTLVMSALETFESNLRQAISYTISEDFSYNQKEYLKRNLYRTGRRQYSKSAHRQAYPIDTLLNVLNGITHSNDEPFKHYREKYQNIPPWVIIKKLNFGNLIWWFRLLKSPQKTKVISILTGMENSIIEGIPNFKSGISSLLSLYLNYRNAAAHGGRIFSNASERHALEYNQIIHNFLSVTPADYRAGKGQNRLGVMAKSLDIFQDKTAYNELKIGLDIYIKQYLALYSDDKEYLLTTTELDENYLNFIDDLSPANS